MRDRKICELPGIGRFYIKIVSAKRARRLARRGVFSVPAGVTSTGKARRAYRRIVTE